LISVRANIVFNRFLYDFGKPASMLSKASKSFFGSPPRAGLTPNFANSFSSAEENLRRTNQEALGTALSLSALLV
jgi:hypothetical protein